MAQTVAGSSIARSWNVHRVANVCPIKTSDPAGTGSKELFIVFHKFNLNWILTGMP